jgi:hypothetical protein
MAAYDPACLVFRDDVISQVGHPCGKNDFAHGLEFSACRKTDRGRLILEAENEVFMVGKLARQVCWFALIICVVFADRARGQLDQGSVTGVVRDSTGGVIAGSLVTLTNLDTGLSLQARTDGSGVYVFSPVKIGRYTVSASAPGFKTTVQENLQLNVQERLNVALSLSPGAVNQTVTVSTAPPLLQTQSGSVGQVVSARTINTTPLAQRNWVYLAQLSAGVVPSSGTRGGGTGDYEANGQRAEQNNFILDGVDNNVNIVDYMNGSTYAVSPPPDAMSEFKLETADFSAEYGHSAGSVLNATIKSGTNQIHGDLWEYFRNTAMDARNWNSLVTPPYHMNQFGATLGFPILKNKLFYFGDLQDTRISYGAANTFTTPTPLMRQGNFSELLNPTLTGNSKPTYLYQPNSAGGSGGGYGTGPDLLTCNGQQNVFCPAQINPVAQKILNLYPAPNANSGKTYNNLVENLTTQNLPFQWDQRLDWDISAKDQAYARYSYVHVMNILTPPLGPILDGTTNFAGTRENYLTENFMVSETHLFTPSLVNEFRFSYNFGNFSNLQANYNANVAASLGLGGMPFGPGYFQNGGLPQISVSGITGFGSHGNNPSIEGQNIYQILDNVTKIFGNHSLKVGIALQNLRILFLQPPASRGSYSYNGTYTGIPGVSNTGSGVADFLADQMNGASITNAPKLNDESRYDAAYIEDSWRVTPALTVQYGLRYDYYQPYREMAGEMANFIPLTQGIGTGSAVYQIPAQSSGVALSPVFTQLLAQDNISLQYNQNPRLSTSQKTNFAPRLGIAYSVDPKTVINAGFGLFYGGIQSVGSSPNISENYPFIVHSALSAVSCTAGKTCPSLTTAAQNYTGAPGATLENGLSNQISTGIINFVTLPVVNGRDPSIKMPYTINYNLSLQRAFAQNMAATVRYVGNVSRHIQTLISSDPPLALIAPGLNTQSIQPFPQFSNSVLLSYSGLSNYNSLQATLEKRYAGGLSYLATYTWSHALDDSTDPLGGGVSYRNSALVPIVDEYTNSNYDVRHRFTFNGLYELPFGQGRRFLNRSRVADIVAGGWSGSMTFVAQTGLPFTVTTSNIPTASGASARAVQVADPFRTGGAPPASNPTVTCAQSTRTRTNWYNPCAFANPLSGSLIPKTGPGSQVTSYSEVLAYTGGKSNTIAGPGFERINMSMFKDFSTYREQHVELRADVFNLFNHPSWANPSTTNNNNTGGLITAPLTLQNNTPDARFFQIAAKYVF